MKIVVLLSTYNGEKYLKEQLDSLIAQTLKPTKIVVRDDGSSDSTLDILNEYSNNYDFIDYYQGDNLKTSKSFWDLIKRNPGYDYYCLCDQDDYWFKDKIKNAVESLEKNDKEIPLLYCSKYTLTDKKLNPINSNVSKLYNFTDFPHSLMYHTAPGCTFVFNNIARDYILEYDLDKEYYVIHDAVIHKVVALFGKVILDNNSQMFYRQHSDNVIGMRAGVLSTFLTRIKNYSSGRLKNYRANSAKGLLNVYGDKCSKENMHLLEMVAYYQTNAKFKKEMLKEKRFKSNSINDLFLKVLIMLNYV